MRALIFLFAPGLWAQGPELDHDRMNVWLFPPTSTGFIAERVIASSAGKIYVGTSNGLYTLELGNYVRVDALPGEAVLELQRLQNGDVGARFSSGSYSVGDQGVRKLKDLVAGPPPMGSFDWAGLAIEIRPITHTKALKPAYELKVTRKSDSKVLLSGNNIVLDQHAYWKAASNERALFAVNGHWILMGAKSAAAEYLSLQLPHLAVDHFVDERNGRIYLALHGEGVGIASLNHDSNFWNIRTEVANAQMLNGELLISHSSGFSRLEPNPYRKDQSLLFDPEIEHTPKSFKIEPDWNIPDAQEILTSQSGHTFLVPRNANPVFRKGKGQWRKLQYAAGEQRELPVRWLAESSDGRVWAAAKHGLMEIVGLAAGTPQLIRAASDLGGSYISEFKRDNSGKLWLLGEGFWASYEQGEWRKKAAPACMLSPKFRSLAIRSEGEFWISYRNTAPVTRVIGQPNQPGSWICQHYGPGEGNPNLETNSVAIDRRGWIWLMGEAGAVVMTDSVAALPWPRNVHQAVVLPQHAYLPAGDAHWHGFVDEDTDHVAMLVGKSLVRMNRSVVTQLSSQLSKLIMARSEDGGFRIRSNSVVPPEIVYSMRWRWIASDGSGLSEFATLKVLREAMRPSGAKSIEILSPAGRQVLDDPFQQQQRLLPISLGAILLALGIYYWRWHVLAIFTSPGVKRKLERHLFLRLRDAEPEQRKAALNRLPKTLRIRLAMLLDQFELVEASEDDRTRSGLILEQRYLLEHVIAKGGFATVYLAQDLTGGGNVAVKLFQRAAHEGSWLAKRLAAEIEAMQRLEHPGVVKLLKHGFGPEGRPYLVMDYIQGVTLRQSLRQGPFEPGRASRIIGQILSALEEVHRQGILHRDLKPENVILRHTGGPEEMAMVIDFGVATVYEEILDGQQSTYFAGSLDYVAPEQVAGLKLEASDVYSVGAVCFEVLSGKRFKMAVGPTGGLAAIRDELQSAGQSNALEVATVLADATTIEHSRRIATITEFRQRLLAAIGG